MKTKQCITKTYTSEVSEKSSWSLINTSAAKPHKLKSYLLSPLLFLLCISIAQADEIGRCKITIGHDGPVLRFAWFYYKDSAGNRKLTSTLPMQMFKQSIKINNTSQNIIICGGNTISCAMHPKARTDNSNKALLLTDSKLFGKTQLVKMGNQEDHVLFEQKNDGTWRYTLKISGVNPSNDIAQEGIIGSKPGDPNQCGIIQSPNKAVAFKYVNNSSTDLINYKHGDCDNGRPCTLQPEAIKFPF